MHPNAAISERRVTVATHVYPHTVPATTRAALATLGYVLVAPNSKPRSRRDRPALRIVDDRLLGEIAPRSGEAETPIVLLTSQRSTPCADPRVIGRAARPAQLDELFPILQQALETAPRRAPRTRAALPARCIQADRRWLGAVVELSTTGCLVESHDWKTLGDLHAGSRLNLHFALPSLDASQRSAPLTLRAEIKELGSSHAGLEFCDASDAVRERVAHYVATSLAG